VKDLVVLDHRHQVAVHGVSFKLCAGEVLGIAGVQGNGQTELVEALTGLRPVQSGTILVDGADVTGSTPRKITEQGVAHVPEDRQRDGLVLTFPVADNLMLNTYYLSPYSKGAVLQQDFAYKTAETLIKDFDIRTPGPHTAAGSLSGGNQQKVIVAREFSRPIKLLIAAQPTRGLDVGSIEYIHRRLLQKRDEGCAVLLISTELDEIMGLSDRIAVMYRGEIVETLIATDVTKEQLGLLMAGMKSGAGVTEEQVT
jgi:simple sugar transport system ATP-binding protein